MTSRSALRAAACLTPLFACLHWCQAHASLWHCLRGDAWQRLPASALRQDAGGTHRLEGGGTKELVELAFDAMGGRDRLARIRLTKATSVGHLFALEQSERPEGPWFAAYTSAETTVDFDKLEIKVEGRSTGLLFPDGQAFSFGASFGEKAGPKQTGSTYAFIARSPRDRLALGPERVLFTALASKELRLGGATTFHGMPHDVLRFTWGVTPVRIFLNRYTHLPVAVETVRTGSGFWAIWGDVTTRTVWGNWDLAPGGILFPTLWAFERNGFAQESDSLTKVEITYGEAEPGAEFAADFEKLAPAAAPPPRLFPFSVVEIAPGIVQYQSQFNCAAVDQGDGIVILEGVVSTGYMAAILADVAKRFPGKPVKAVVSTDDAWPHIGGLRFFVATQIPIYALALNGPILNRLFQARFTLRPDDLERGPRRPVLRLIDGKASIGKGDNRIDLYPMHGSVAERMLYGYFPGRKLLYAPDVIQRDGDKWFNVNLVDEMLKALARDGLQPANAFAFHSGLVGLDALRDIVAKTKAKP